MTGTSPGGIGAAYVIAVAAASPALIILAGRTTEAIAPTEKTIREANPAVKTKLLAIELGSFKSIRKAAEELNGWEDIPYDDILVANAGIMGGPHRKTEDGFESQFGVNHLGHFLFTNLIMDKILASKSPRVVSVSSFGHRLGGVRWLDFNFEVCICKSSLSQRLRLIASRMERRTTTGGCMGSPRQPTFSSPLPSRAG